MAAIRDHQQLQGMGAETFQDHAQVQLKAHQRSTDNPEPENLITRAPHGGEGR